MAHFFYKKYNEEYFPSFFKNGPIPASFSVYFRLYNMLQFKFKFKLKKSVDGVLGIQTRGGRMEGANESTELWRHPLFPPFTSAISIVMTSCSLLIDVLFISLGMRCVMIPTLAYRKHNLFEAMA